LCPNNINHIEVGEDVNSRHDQKMGDIDSPPDVPNFMSITEFDANPVVNSSDPFIFKNCTSCHNPNKVLGDAEQGQALPAGSPCNNPFFPSMTGCFMTPQGQSVFLSFKIFPSDTLASSNINLNLAPCVLATNDPDVTLPAGGQCGSIITTPKPLSAVCAAIESSTALASDPKVDLKKEIQLCERLVEKIQGD
jgi:hypothetical protein